MIVSNCFTQRMRSVTFAAANDAPFFRVVVTRERMPRKYRFARRRFNGMRDFVSEAERRRLRTTASCAKRAIRIPRDRIRPRIEMIVVAIVDRQTKMPRAFIETPEQAPLRNVA